MFTHSMHGPADHPTMKLCGPLTLEHARQIHALLGHPALPASLTLDLGESDSSDISFIQILIALLKDPGRTIRFLPPPTHLIELAAAVGADSLTKEIMNRIEEPA